MRIRTALAFVLLLPSIASAQQRRPEIGTTDVGRPTPLGRQPNAVARSQSFVRSRYSVEAYPLLSRVVAPGLSDGAASSWTSFGSGARVDWRTNRYMSFTLDLTSTYLGGQSVAASAEAGVRLRPEHWESRLRPFADARIGYEHSAENYPLQSSLGIGPASQFAPRSRESRGFGGIIGGGVEYGLTNTMALTTGVSAMRSNMAAYHLTGVSIPAGGDHFVMTRYRLTLGLKWNPVYSLKSSVNEQTR